MKYTLTEKDLDSLSSFKKEDDGSYSNDEFKIMHNMGVYSLHFYCDEETWFIKNLRNIFDLKRVYRAITEKKLT